MPERNENGEEVMKCGFRIGGGIDQDFRKSPQGYEDNVRVLNLFYNINFEIFFYFFYINQMYFVIKGLEAIS